MSQFQVPKKKNKKKKNAKAEVKSSPASSKVPLASEPVQLQPGKVATQVQPSKVDTKVQPDKAAPQGQPGKAAVQGQPGKVAAQGQPSKVAAQGQPSKVAAQGQPGKATTQVQQKGQPVNNKNVELGHNIKEVLPQKVGMTTKIKDVEVTMTSNENDVNGATKKKKKKKKSKQKLNEEGGEPSNEKEKLLHFTENHIELLNHPEISVTISNNPTPEVKEPPKVQENGSKVSSNGNETAEKVDTPAVSKKKKKKKKKKNSISENPVPTLPTPTEPSEDANSPTYIKLPALGDNCVLLVSHESFSNGSKQATNNSTSQDTQNKPATVLLKKKEDNSISNETASSKTAVEKSNSVSVFPVYSDNSNNKKEKNSEFNVEKSLGKISDKIKQENDNSLKNGIVSEEKDSNATDPAEENTKTKAQLKAERRAIQEAQRAAKLAKNTEKDTAKDSIVNEQNKKVVNTKEQQSIVKTNIVNESLLNKENTKSSVEREIYRKVQIFSHLPQYRDLLGPTITNLNSRIPPPIFELGIHYSKGTICGSNARCVGFLAAVREVIGDYRTSQKKKFLKDLESQLPNYLAFLGNCRPLSVSIVNAHKFLKHQINHIPENTAEDVAKESLCQSINDFVREEILLAKEAITISSSAKIVDNDTILVYAYSSLVKDVLCKAHDQKKSFRVIVVDSRAKLEGLQLLRQLVEHGLRCCYISINAISTVIKKVTKVVLGAHALLANGYVMSRLGCKILSLVSSANSVPVLVCCETYKFWERSLTDSIVHNELGNPEDLISFNKKDTLLKWHELSSLHIYNLLYDVTPSDLISVVITEKGLIPCSSVPVLLRVKHAGRQE